MTHLCGKLYVLVWVIVTVVQSQLSIPSLPTDHLLCWFRNLPHTARRQVIDQCNHHPLPSVDPETTQSGGEKTGLFNTDLCKLIQLLQQSPTQRVLPCWGHESDASQDCLLYSPQCPHSAQSWAPNKVEQLKNFFNTADFGYVRERKAELTSYCVPDHRSRSPTSHLKCTKFLRFCTGRNVYLDFRRLNTLTEPIRYRDDVLAPGDIGGWNCVLDRQGLRAEGDHKSPLMSWFAEIGANFEVRPDSEDAMADDWCDVTLHKPTFVMKLDSTINMYHHFCDFVNLYASVHVNGSHFDRDNHIVVWDTVAYRSNFASVWQAFTRNPVLDLAQFRGKRVCVKQAVFPLLPRMIFGLYYNMPLIPGCERSGLMRAFNRHLTAHLGLTSTEDQLDDPTVRLTFIERNTDHRRVVNQDELVAALRQRLHARDEDGRVEVRVVDFHHRMPFVEQARLSARSDILVGVHGAGLTHTLFQPDYGVLFELYNCGDPECYKDLARLRGTHYLTWRNVSALQSLPSDHSDHELGAAHAKFVHYRFDVDEFVHIALEAIESVRRRKREWRHLSATQWWRHATHKHSTESPPKTEL